MSKYPVEINDQEGLADAVNYLLSGPGGLGQNFAGYSAYAIAYLTGNYRIPYTQPEPAKLYVPPILCSEALQLDDRTFQYTFASAQPTPPFASGNNIAGTGWANGFYNGGQGVIGVIDCTTTYVRFRTTGSYPGTGDDFGGGYVYWDATVDGSTGDPLSISTDCNARVTVTGGTDRVFISGQISNRISYESVTGGDLYYRVQINRYAGFPNSDPVNPDYLFLFDETVSEKTYSLGSLTGSGTLDEIDTIFSTVIDKPKPAYYWYILEVRFATTGDLKIDQCEFNLRSLSSQVVKQ